MVSALVLLPVAFLCHSVLSYDIDTSTIAHPQLVTSPQFCFDDFECPEHQFCLTLEFPGWDDAFAPAQKIASCVTRASQGATCHGQSVSCEEGNYCSFEQPSKCLPQLPEGSECYSTRSEQCQGDLVCESSRFGPPVCQPLTLGIEGDFCQYARQCQVGLFCHLGNNQCTPRKSPGEPCWPPQERECLGFCAGPLTAGRCQRKQKVDEMCTGSSQCQNLPSSLGTPRTIVTVCNSQSDLRGICVLATDLIKDLGLACNPEKDKCDDRRGLSCAPVNGTYLCIQNGKSGSPYCTPNSPLSSCPPDILNNPRECRRRLLDTRNEFKGLFMCRRKLETVPLGMQCNMEHIICEPGASCIVPPGVDRDRSSSRYYTPVMKTCMKIVPIGSECIDQFRYSCEQGSFCVNGTCQVTETPPTVPVTFAYVGGPCANLSCPPGTMCTQDSEWSQEMYCRHPVLEKGLGESCDQSALFHVKCKEGLYCSFDDLSEGRRICRRKRGLGARCDEMDACEGHLACIAVFGPHSAWCIDPYNSLNLGDPCNPESGLGEPRCGVTSVHESIGSGWIPLACLQKNDGHVCQQPARLFAPCSEDENVTCFEKETVCSESNVCVPVSEI